jgi:hypothetical protein
MTIGYKQKRELARAAGFLVREGAYRGTADDRLGRWYIDHEANSMYLPFGPGFASQKEAWEQAYRNGLTTGDITNVRPAGGHLK